jgi:deoxyadenosine/deoxycytidine kinase
MSEVQQLETSVMVTERNWSALLEMQDRLFRQQMQLDVDLKTLLTREDAQNALTEMQESAEKFERQAGNLNEKYSSGCKALTESTKIALTTILNDTKNQLSDMEQTAQKKIITCAWISTAAVILCTALCSLVVLWSR